jgi:hypothetical protein
LQKLITKDWQKVSKLFQQYYSKVKETTGDAYLLWRIKQMINDGRLEMQGNIKNMKEFEVRLGGLPAEQVQEQATSIENQN